VHYYKKNIGDYAKKAGRLSMLQHGAYTLLIDACYDREKFPTIDEAIEWSWASTPEEEAAVRFVLSKFFKLENGEFIQNRIKEEIEEYKSKAELNKRIAIERETKRKESGTNRTRTVHEAPPNHKPITNNQEPIKDKGTRRKASLPVSVDWAYSEATEARACKEFGLSQKQVNDYRIAFIDICQAKGYTYANIDSAFMNCIRKDWPGLRNGKPVTQAVDVASQRAKAEIEKTRAMLDTKLGPVLKGMP
jgi:uncharacterized protein YdaU (DUF1376 family)